MNRSLLAAGRTFGLGLLLLSGFAAGEPQRSTAVRGREAAAPKSLARTAPAAGSLHRVPRGQRVDPCPRPAKAEGFVPRESAGKGFTVDLCGRRSDPAGDLLPQPPSPAKSTAPLLTIDRMTTQYSSYHYAGEPLVLVGSADDYTLNDGSHWSSGAGGHYNYESPLDHVEVSGNKLRFVLSPPDGGAIYQQTDYDSGDHSAQGTLAASGPLVLEAQAGSTTAVLHTSALLVSNDATWYGVPLFNYYTALVGSVVPVDLTFTLQDGTWAADSFSRQFYYYVAGSVDFAHPLSSPQPVALLLSGPARLPDETTTSFTATLRYDNGIERDAGFAAAWTVDPPQLASVTHGVLTIGALPSPEADLTLHATWTEGAASLAASKTVHVVADLPAEAPGTWPMFQANARHTGAVDSAIEPTILQLRWQKALGSGYPLNPVAAGDGKVFASLVTYFNDVPTFFALRAQDGATLWSKGFGDVFSVNPPSYAYGNVYLQTGNHASDTWLHAYDATTGEEFFKAPHAAQWERYLAPTVFEGKVYVNGGYYGGMYGFDAFTGEQLWFAYLPQYDEWTPAVDAGHAYAYVGDYDPGLYVQDRASGASSYFVPDPAFEWNGWSMGLAPVLGDHDDLIAIHDGRLISFDTATHAIRWQVQAQYSGQPSLARGSIYAIEGGRLRVLDELSHAEQWSWQAPDGELTGTMIVTGRHVFASTDHWVYAVDLGTHLPVWSYPVGGKLALAEGTLYVASSDGTLSAFAPPAGTSFYTLTPCRLVDTRLTTALPIGGPALSGGIARTMHIGGLCGIPAGAKALAANVTITEATAPGYLRLDGTGNPALLFSTVNYPAGTTRANLVVLAVGPNGDLTAVAEQSPGTTVQMILDVTGYFQ